MSVDLGGGGIIRNDCRRRARYGVRQAACFGYRTGRGAADDGGVVGAVDGDSHYLCSAIRRLPREGVAQATASVERLHCTVAVVERVGPHAACCHGISAVTVGSG